jgi:DnaJ-class molecular chaperone
MTDAKYTQGQCANCNGTGTHFDPTTQDKVYAGPFAGRCAECSGRGVVYVSVPAPDLLASQRREDDRIRATYGDTVDDIPDWMC